MKHKLLKRLRKIKRFFLPTPEIVTGNWQHKHEMFQQAIAEIKAEKEMRR